jgi:hypothetical protein
MLPLLEAKMLHQYDHRYGDYADVDGDADNLSLPDISSDRLGDPAYAPKPRYWVDAAEVEARLEGIWSHNWLLGWRDITGTEKQRTLIASVVPRVAVGHSLPLLFPNAAPSRIAALYANLCSFALDYAARQKVGGTHMTCGVLKQLPVLAPRAYDEATPWPRGKAWGDWILPRVIELTYTAWDLEPFAQDVGYDGPPFRWDPVRRFLLRAELDAAFFHLYGLSRDDTDYVMDTFPIVRKNDEKAHGEYRTKRVILEVYDAIAEAARTGKAYQTRLDPPPADPSVAHPARARQPVPVKVDMAALPAGAWARPHNDEPAETGAAIAAALKAFGRAAPSREVRLAAILLLEPRLLVPSLGPTEAANWRRVVGDDAAPLPAGVAAVGSHARS